MKRYFRKVNLQITDFFPRISHFKILLLISKYFHASSNIHAMYLFLFWKIIFLFKYYSISYETHLHWKKPFLNIIFIDRSTNWHITRSGFPSARNPASLFCVFWYWTNDRARRGVKIVCCRQWTTFDSNRLFNCVCANTTPRTPQCRR